MKAAIRALLDERRNTLSEETALVPVASKIPEPHKTFHLVACNPQQMAEAQADLAAFFREKVEEISHERTDVASALRAATEHGWATATLKRQAERGLQRWKFYDKCLRASEAGFAIIPNIPVDVFAVRVNRSAPHDYQELNDASSWQQPTLANQRSDKLVAGEGNYVSNENTEIRGSHPEVKDDGKEGLTKWVQAVDFGEVEFPMIAAAPQVMDATGRAMLLRIFDEIGVSPQRTRKGDPLIIGRIVMAKTGWQEKVISFLIAWHLDLRTL
jgi:hypothetical protein